MKFLSACLSCLVLSIFGLSTNNDNGDFDYQNISAVQNIKLYEEVLHTYYLDYLHNNANQTEYSFEEFEDNYYSLFKGILVTDYVDITSKISKENLQEYSNKVCNSKSGDVNFQLGCGKDTITSINRFHNGPPFYNVNYYNLIQNGDIFIENASGHFYHVGVVSDIAYPYGLTIQMGTYIQVIEAINDSNGVQFGYLDDQRIIDNQIEIYRYHLGLTTAEFYSIVFFLDEQIGDAYSLSYFMNTSFYNDLWYCGELVYAAYLYAGIDIAPSYNPDDDLYILGTDICEGTNAIVVVIERNRFLSLQLIGFNTTQYTVRVYNNASKLITIYYASSSVTSTNAKKWINLGTVQQTNISSGSYSDIVITKNSNQYIATSFCYTNLTRVERLITYAYVTSTYSLLEYHNVIFG